MTAEEKKTRFTRITLPVSGLAIPDEKKAELEKSVEEMAQLADSLGYLDPLDEEPSVIFDPQV